MHRRTFIRASLTLGLAVSLPLGGCSRNKIPVSLPSTIDQLKSLQGKHRLLFEGPWPAYATFTHIAQSIEMSLTGFPEHKSEGFKRWVGQPVFWAFKQVGAMSHDTAEPIPGAPVLDLNNHDPIAINQSIQRVINALEAFDVASTLAPHFAYGALEPSDYLLAHIFHINDHLALLQND